MNLGQTVTLPCIIDGSDFGMMPATVTYIHPQNRFCVVEIKFKFGAFRETLYLGDRARPGAEPAPKRERKA